GPFDEQRLMLGHLREGMPNVLAVPAEQIVERGLGHFLRSKPWADQGYHFTSTFSPSRTPSIALALSPTIANSRKPLGPSMARNVKSGSLWSAGKMPTVSCSSQTTETLPPDGTVRRRSCGMSVMRLPLSE